MATTSLMAPLPTDPPFKLDYEKLRDFEFSPPTACPTYRPTEEEFAMGPLEYINKIRPQAEKFGICKIIPPKSFLVPFAIDIAEFRFTPRVQRINELEAMTRVKLMFHDRVYKFWDLQGITLRYPTYEKKMLDIYTLHLFVKEEGGYELCTRDRKWAKIAVRMNYTKSTASVLRTYYEKVLFPYDIFLSGASINPEIENTFPSRTVKYNNESEFQNTTASGSENEVPPENVDLQNSELKKLQVFGAGPKMPGFNEFNDVKCRNCDIAGQYPSLLTCNACQNSFHKQCLLPNFSETPRGQWHCHGCLSRILPKRSQSYAKDFGFVQSNQTYTLLEFGEMANDFKSNYFSIEAPDVPADLVEKAFWLNASLPDGSLKVEYGADLHTNDYGSGFPTNSDKYSINANKAYIDSPWNLNNLPTLNGSVFKHINTNINGMILPWMYVGMCFSAFCWHNEDHWTYSINFNHFGDPKIWYGIPGVEAENFENALRSMVPDLFTSSPDLLHQLVTTCNPNLLAKLGVPIYKAHQQAGEFVVTYPRAYHSGFNQGLNFAEAVNFATSDWLTIGRQSVAHYSSLHRYPVFSHDELVCKMADSPVELEMRLAVATYEEILQMINREVTQRMNVHEMGVLVTKRNFLENLKDDERLCEFCKTTCFLSALQCKCNEAKLVCLNHIEQLCSKCSYEQFTLVYRYTLDEMKIMKTSLTKHIEEYKGWEGKVESAIKCSRKRQQSVI